MDVFKPIAQQQAETAAAHAKAREEQHARIRAAFATGAGAIAWLRQAKELADAQPSYRPGQDAQHTAYNEGRRSVLHELVRAIDEAMKG